MKTPKEDDKSTAELAEEAAWEVVDNTPDIGDCVALLRKTLAPVKDRREREAILSGIVSFLSTRGTFAQLQPLLDDIKDHHSAADLASRIAAEALKHEKDARLAIEYATSRLAELPPDAKACSSWIRFAAVLASVKGPIEHPIQEAEKIILRLGTTIASAELQLALASAWNKAGEKEKTIAATDRLIEMIQLLPTEPERELLILQALNLYIEHAAENGILTCLEELSPEAKDLNTRTSAQQVLRKAGDYDLSDRLISQIKDPKQHFLALESRFSYASTQPDIPQMGKSVKYIQESLSTFDDVDKANASLIIIRYFALSDQMINARNSLEQAQSQINMTSGPERDRLQKRLDRLKQAIGN